jgi:nicotinamidase/pyrazinamidase
MGQLKPRTGDALIIVDVQNDFLPSGALAVPRGNTVIEPLNHCADVFERRGLPIFATRDWHPPDHCSFRPQGGPWPPHCIAGTAGAGFAPGLSLPWEARIVSKATRPDADAYSGFQGTDLAAQLKDLGCTRVFIGGLATDYCVRATALDARDAGFDVVVLEDAVKPVDAEPGDGQRAFQEMAAHGVGFSSVQHMLASNS